MGYSGESRVAEMDLNFGPGFRVPARCSGDFSVLLHSEKIDPVPRGADVSS
jgi:hypothetical protein